MRSHQTLSRLLDKDSGGPAPAAPTAESTSPPPAPAPDAAPPAEPAPAAPPAAPEPKTGADDPEIQVILASLGKTAKKDPDPPVVPAEPAAPPAPPAPAPPDAAPKPGEAPVKVRPAKVFDEAKLREIANRVFDEKLKAGQPPAAAAPPASPAPPAAATDPTAGLSAPRKRILEVAEFVESTKNRPGLKQEWLEYWKKQDSYVEREREKDPERTFDRSDDDYQRWLAANKPKVDEDQWREWEVDKIVDDRVRDSDTRRQAEMAEFKESQRINLEVKPRIMQQQQRVVEHVDYFVTSAKDDSPLAGVKKLLDEHKGDWDKVIEADPLIAPMVIEEQENAAYLATEYLALRHGLTKVDPKNLEDPNHPHARIIKMIREEADWFDQNGGDRKIRVGQDGQKMTFVPPRKMDEIRRTAPDELGKYWTFDEPIVLSLIAVRAANKAEQRAKEHMDKLSKAGFARPTAVQPQKQEAPPEPSPSPKARGSQGPGAGTTAPVESGNRAFDMDELKALGIDGVAKRLAG